MAAAPKKSAKAPRKTPAPPEAKGSAAKEPDALAREAAAAPKEPRWRVPWWVLLQEAATAAAFVDARWASTKAEGAALPGIEAVAAQLPRSVADEIRALAARAQAAHHAYLLHARPPKGEDARPRAEEVLGEITAALEFLFDDGVDDARDAQLAAVADSLGDAGESNAALAAALEGYGALGREHRTALAALGTFNAAMIDEVPALAAALRAPTSGGATDRSPEAVAALTERNRYANLLCARVGRVRAAAMFVFRKHPEVAREATSAYQRRQRASARRAKQARDEEPTG